LCNAITYFQALGVYSLHKITMRFIPPQMVPVAKISGAGSWPKCWRVIDILHRVVSVAAAVQGTTEYA